MKEISIPVLWAATEYYLGALLWIGLAAVLVALVLWVIVVRRSVDLRAALAGTMAPILALAGLAAIAATASIPWLTRSHWSYVSGPTDYVVLIGEGLGAALAVVYFLTPILVLGRSQRA
jgi:hypothetical protein